MVISPAVPPYSSTTIATWTRCCCISCSSSSTFLVSGTYDGSRASGLTGAVWLPSRRNFSRSLAYTTPVMLSMLPS